MLHIRWTASENEIAFWKKWPSHLRVKSVISEPMLRISSWALLTCMLLSSFVSFVQVMAWCRQTTSHFLSQFWHRSMSPLAPLAPKELICITLEMISPYRNGTDTWHPIFLHCQSFGYWIPGPWFNINMSYQYRKSHCVDKTVVRSSYLHNGISYTGKTTSLYWIRALAALRLQS